MSGPPNIAGQFWQNAQQQPSAIENYMSSLAKQQAITQQQQAGQQRQAQFAQQQQDQQQQDRLKAVDTLGAALEGVQDGDAAGFERVKQFAVQNGLVDPAQAQRYTVNDLPQLRALSAQARQIAQQRSTQAFQASETAKNNALAAGGGSAERAPSSPQTVDIKDQNGEISSVLAQQLPNGQWVTADEKRTPLPSPEAIHPASEAGGRSQIYLGRTLQNAKDLASELQNISAMPVSASRGWFGGVSPKTNILTAPLNTLVQSLNPQDIQSYNVSSKGMARAVAGLATQGMAVNQGLIDSFEQGLSANEGDTTLTRALKLATFRQHAENALEVAAASPQVSGSQKKLITETLAKLRDSIPYSPMDVIQLSQSGQTNMTLKDFMARRKPQAAAPAPGQSNVVQEYVPGGPPAGAQEQQQPAAQSGWTVRRVQ